MAKFTETERKQKVDYAKQLYCKGFELAIISKMLEVSVSTVRKWSIKEDFERAKKSQFIALSELRNSILESYAEMLEGKQPKVKPDAVAKYASAFEKFSDKKKVLSYTYESFELLTEEYVRNIEKQKKTADKETLLKEMQQARKFMDNVITRLTNEVLNNE